MVITEFLKEMLPYVFGQMVLPAPDDDREKVHTIFQPAQGEQAIPSVAIEGAIFYFDGDYGGGRHKATFDSAGFSVSPISAER